MSTREEVLKEPQFHAGVWDYDVIAMADEIVRLRVIREAALALQGAFDDATEYDDELADLLNVMRDVLDAERAS